MTSTVEIATTIPGSPKREAPGPFRSGRFDACQLPSIHSLPVLLLSLRLLGAYPLCERLAHLLEAAPLCRSDDPITMNDSDHRVEVDRPVVSWDLSLPY